MQGLARGGCKCRHPRCRHRGGQRFGNRSGADVGTPRPPLPVGLWKRLPPGNAGRTSGSEASASVLRVRAAPGNAAAAPRTSLETLLSRRHGLRRRPEHAQPSPKERLARRRLMTQTPNSKIQNTCQSVAHGPERVSGASGQCACRWARRSAIAACENRIVPPALGEALATEDRQRVARLCPIRDDVAAARADPEARVAHKDVGEPPEQPREPRHRRAAPGGHLARRETLVGRFWGRVLGAGAR
jgi:hypothetical protein